MSAHTKEPWQTWQSVNNGACYIVPMPYSGFGNIALCDSPETARRIVACVNACAEVPQDWLETGTPGCVQNVRDERDQYKRQRDDLLAALESIADGPDPLASYHKGISCGIEDCMIEDKYEAAEYGYDCALQYCAHIANGVIKSVKGSQE